ncbi:hypothetical protein Ddye_022245 [Dipteronia dyeriana]|uniref:N-acetyltransferase domain-containing protein n=1 Tax=Dipteronia dyeriana TaxID=168575 RepID=A0AAD9U448_9ROSI|nr:hypothetical protein Ddye_022245 [Dipteronia dyeriana]
MQITLCPYQLSDVDYFMEWANDDQVICSGRLRHYTKEDALTYLQEESIPHPWYRTICLDGHLIGFVSVKPGSDHQRCRGERTNELCFGRVLSIGAKASQQWL